jgi:hypothetical protein
MKDEAKLRVLPQSAEAQADRSQAAETGPGTAGRTIAGAAYSGQQIAAHEEKQGPPDPGFPQ